MIKHAQMRAWYTKKEILYSILIFMLTALLALIPIRYNTEVLPVVEGKAYWPSDYPTNRTLYALDGMWELHIAQNEPTVHEVPKVAWKYGAGIYTAKLFIEDASTTFDLYTINAGTNYILLVNDVIVGASGMYSEKANESVASAATTVHSFKVSEGWNIIEFRVSNFVHPRGGLWEHVYMSRSPHLSIWHTRWRAFDLIIFGMLLMFVLMHLLIGLFTKNQSYFLWFALGALAAACGGITRNQFAIFALFPDFPYIALKKIQIVTLMMAGGFFVSAFLHQFTRRRDQLIVRLFRYFCGVTVIITVLLPFSYIYSVAIFFLPVMALVLGYVLYFRITFLYNKKISWESSKLFGDIALTYGVLHDFFNILQASYEIQLLPYMVFVYVSFYSIVLSSDFFLSLKRNEQAKYQIMNAWDEARALLASDLHDGAIQLAIGLKFLCSGAVQKGLYDKHLLQKIEKTAQQIGEELRITIDSLNPARIESHGLLHAITELAQRIQATYEIDIQTQYKILEQEIPPHICNNLYYIVSEATTNALRHAYVSQILLVIETLGNDIFLRVLNDGVSTEKPFEVKSGHGLDIIRYRAESLGGTCTMRMNRATWFYLEIKVPRSRT